VNAGRIGPEVPFPDPPVGLSPASTAVWPRLVADLQAIRNASAGNLLRLEGALLARDRLRAVTEALDAAELVTEGSTGQRRPNPLLTLEAALRREVASTLASLGLAASPRTPRATHDGHMSRNVVL